MLDVYHLVKEAMNLKLVVIDEPNEKKTEVFLLVYKFLNHKNCSNCQEVTEAKDGSVIVPMSKYFENIIGR
jgi:ArsR family metal-binding transcriptional regulator